MYIKRLIILVLLLLPLPAMALDVPRLTGRVNDYAALLSPEAKTSLEQKLAAFERETSNQIVVLTIPTLQGDVIEQFAIRVAEQWKPGQKGKDNGVLLILAKAERKVRIEVGMGLQGVLPDITASHIIRDVMRPSLQTGNFDQGITAGVDAILAATKGEFKAAPQDAKRSGKPHRTSHTTITLFLLAVVAALILGTFSRYLGGAAGAAGLPLAAWFSFPGISLITLVLLGAAGFAGGLLLSLLLSGWSGGGGGGYFGGGWGGGFFGGGFGGGSSGSDDGGFSGGGGDFDGGGSSDDY
ncbi:MAG TPA: TPM domain-containing protein [Desulfuromonadaceae bacterium]